ncbi:hypothetical protein [Acinetobacter johnsonii]|uniref:hypothetical protein n=2 Tax=Moraxellaceae TaxID=468 RepID=UPI001F40BDF8|nr:hypothetical protein [Acinetobacter johnsonii]
MHAYSQVNTGKFSYNLPSLCQRLGSQTFRNSFIVLNIRLRKKAHHKSNYKRGKEMQTLYLFKLFCFIFAATTAFNLYTELTLSHISIWQVLIHGGLLMILLEFGFKSQRAPQQPTPLTSEIYSLETKNKPTSQPSSMYCNIFSKIGLVSIFSSLIAQSLIS